MSYYNRTSKEISEAILRGREAGGLSTAILPVGCIEQHGPYLPIETDSLIADSFSLALAEALGNAAFVFKYPAIHYSPTRSAKNYAGTVSVDETVFRDYFREVCLSVLRTGFDAVVVVSGHGPADPSIREVIFSIIDAQFDEKSATKKPVVVVSLAEFSFALGEKFNQKTGRHADWREFLMLRHVLGRDFFSESRMAELRKFRDENNFEIVSAGLVPGVPLEYRSVEGVIGDPLPSGEEDLDRLTSEFWNALVNVVTEKILADLKLFFQIIKK